MPPAFSLPAPRRCLLALPQERWLEAGNARSPERNGDHQAVLALLLRALSPLRDGDAAPAGGLAATVAARAVEATALSIEAMLRAASGDDGAPGAAGERASTLLRVTVPLFARAFALAEAGLAAGQQRRDRGGDAAPPSPGAARQPDPDADLVALAAMLRALACATLSLVQHQLHRQGLLGQRGSQPPPSAGRASLPLSDGSAAPVSSPLSATVVREASAALTAMADSIEKALSPLLAAAVERAASAAAAAQPPQPPDGAAAPPSPTAALAAAAAALAYVLTAAADPDRLLAASSPASAAVAEASAAAGPEGRLGTCLARLAHAAWRGLEALLKVRAFV